MSASIPARIEHAAAAADLLTAALYADLPAAARGPVREALMCALRARFRDPSCPLRYEVDLDGTDVVGVRAVRVADGCVVVSASQPGSSMSASTCSSTGQTFSSTMTR